MDEARERSGRFAWPGMVAAAALVAFARAALVAAKDGWLESGQIEIGLASFARNATANLHWVFAASILLAGLSGFW